MQLLKKLITPQKTQDQTDNEYARDIASKMSTPDIRKEGFANILGILAILGYLKDQGLECSIKRSLHKISSVLEEFSITDIYYDNYRIDVISNYNTNITKIPKCHVDYDIMADYYIIIKLSQNLKDFRILGYMKPDDIIMSYHDNNYYYPDKRLPLKDLFNIMLAEKKEFTETIGKHIDCEALFLRFLNNELSYSYKKTFIKHLLTCTSCTRKFEDFNNFHFKAIQSPRYPYLIQAYFDKISTSSSALYREINYPIKKIVKNKQQPSIIKAFLKGVDYIQDSVNQFLDVEQIETQSKNAKNKNEAIDFIFHDKPRFDVREIVFEKKKVLFLISAVAIILGSILIFAVVHKPDSDLTPPDSAVQEEFLTDDLSTNEFYDSSEHNSNVISNNGIEFEPIETQEVYHSSSIYAIKKISWEVPIELSNKTNYMRFLQVAGKNIKANLENDMLQIADNPTGKTVKADVLLSTDGAVSGVRITKGSTRMINEIVEKSINNAFAYIQPPKSNKEAELTLIIEF